MIGYLDLPSGLSGDMMLGCLMDAGWPVERLRAVVEALRLPASEWRVDAKRVMKGAVVATFAEVHAVEGHVHRHLHHIRDIINAADLPNQVKERAILVFTRLAEAEAKVHGTTVEKIHFHEVGAVDAIIDIVGGVAGLHELGVEELWASAVPLGEGWADTAHGRIPLPAPATLELVAAAGMPTRPAPGPGEWVTPTGAALLSALATFGQPAMRVTKTGIGAGRKETAWPNIARLWLGEREAAGGGGGSATLVQLETNIDDMNPQLYAAVSERLFAAGAKDVWHTPVQMKKGRPGVVLSVLAPASAESALCDILLRETTTLGVRALPVAHRREAQRAIHHVATPYGTVHVKVKLLDGEPVSAAPEYGDCVKRATEAGVGLKAVHDAATAAAYALLTKLRDARPAVQPLAEQAEPSHGHSHGHDHHHHDHDHAHPHDHPH